MACPCEPSSNDSEYDLMKKILTRLCENGGRLVPAIPPDASCCPRSRDSKWELLKKILIASCEA